MQTGTLDVKSMVELTWETERKLVDKLNKKFFGRSWFLKHRFAIKNIHVSHNTGTIHLRLKTRKQVYRIRTGWTLVNALPLDITVAALASEELLQELSEIIGYKVTCIVNEFDFWYVVSTSS